MTTIPPRAALRGGRRAADGSQPIHRVLVESWRAFARDVARTRDAFENYLAVGVLGGVVLPSRIPPRRGVPRLMERRTTFRTRLGPSLESELGNTWPIVKIFRDWESEVPLDWSSVRRIVEVGGHVGAFALWAAAHAPAARIITFEPEPRNFRDLRANVERNGLGDRIVTIDAAAAAEDGRRTLAVPIQRNKAGFTVGPGDGSIEVECVGLERYLSAEVPDAIDIVKLDCEGAEWEILPSLSGETYGRIRHVIVGCHAHGERQLEEMRGFLAERGFASRVVETGSDPDFPLLATIWGERRALE